MPLNNPRPGVNFAPEYQVSGLPWVLSGSVGTVPVEYDLPMVSRAVTVSNNSAAGNFLLIGFTTGSMQTNTNTFPLDGGKALRFELRVRDLWFRGQNSTVNFAVMAELTSIERSKMPYLTGSLASTNPMNSSSFVYPGVG